ncbi:MAG: hypothetical protein QM756_39135 [Polyangiaceae bacterium]
MSNATRHGFCNQRSKVPLRAFYTALWFGLGVSACAGSLPTPSPIEHPESSFVEVPYPPPAALAETVPTRPNAGGLVWLEGDWAFRGTSYAWVRGGWVVAPQKARYASSKVIYARDGRVLFAPASWYDEQGQKLERVRPLSPAVTPLNEYTGETQTAR